MEKKEITEVDITKKIILEIDNYIYDKKIDYKKFAESINVKYTTFFSWLENLEKGKCIAVKNILKIEKGLNKSIINFF